MSGMRMGYDMVMRTDQQMRLAPRMIQSMEILQLPIADLLAKIAKELQENPFLEQKEKHGEQDGQPAEFETDSTPLKHDESGDLEFNRLDELNREINIYLRKPYTVTRRDDLKNMRHVVRTEQTPVPGTLPLVRQAGQIVFGNVDHGRDPKTYKRMSML